MQQLPPATDTPVQRARLAGRDAAGTFVRWLWSKAQLYGAVSPTSSTARRFGSFGEGSILCFPVGPRMNEQSVHLGANVLIAPDVTISAGWGPDHPGLPPRIVTIGDRCLIGRGSSVIGHRSITIGNDVWTGHQVHITDMNHGYEDLERPISVQHQPEAPVEIGDGSWLGHGVVVLPGARIGRHVVVGAGSVVVGDLPDNSVAVGVPARVIRLHDGERWISLHRDAAGSALDPQSSPT